MGAGYDIGADEWQTSSPIKVYLPLVGKSVAAALSYPGRPATMRQEEERR